MIDSTPTASGAVVDQRSARSPQPVVEADAGRQAEEGLAARPWAAGEELCPAVFELGDDGVSHVIDPEGCAAAGCCEEAAEECPVEAISLA